MKKFLYAMTLLTGMFLVSCANSSSGDKASTGDAAPVANTAGAKSAAVNAGDSKVNWTGTKPTGQHTGYINVKSGNLSLDNGEIVGGKIVLDMNSLTVTDLEGDYKANLEGHLKGSADDNKDDFFNVAAYPEASFEITKVAKLAGDAAATHLVYGNLTMKDVTKELGFKASISNNAGAIKVSTPDFTINRTDWNIKYGSKAFFDNLKDNFINDDVTLSLELSAG